MSTLLRIAAAPDFTPQGVALPLTAAMECCYVALCVVRAADAPDREAVFDALVHETPLPGRLWYSVSAAAGARTVAACPVYVRPGEAVGRVLLYAFAAAPTWQKPQTEEDWAACTLGPLVFGNRSLRLRLIPDAQPRGRKQEPCTRLALLADFPVEASRLAYTLKGFPDLLYPLPFDLQPGAELTTPPLAGVHDHSDLSLVWLGPEDGAPKILKA